MSIGESSVERIAETAGEESSGDSTETMRPGSKREPGGSVGAKRIELEVSQRVRGTVRDVQGRGVAGVRLLARPLDERSEMPGQESFSDEVGDFVLEGLSAEKWEVKAESDSASFEAAGGGLWGEVLAPGRVDFVQRAASMLRLEIKNGLGELIPRAQVQIWGASETRLGDAIWSPSRPLVAVADECTELRIQAGRYGELEAKVVLGDRSLWSGSLALVLEERAVVAVRVEEIQDSEAADYYEVYLLPSHEVLQEAEYGRNNVNNLVIYRGSESAFIGFPRTGAGPYELLVFCRGRLLFRDSISVADGINEVRVALERSYRGGKIPIRALDEQGRLASDLSLTIHRTKGAEGGAEVGDENLSFYVALVRLKDQWVAYLGEDYSSWVESGPGDAEYSLQLTSSLGEKRIPWGRGDQSGVEFRFSESASLFVEFRGLQGSGCERGLSVEIGKKIRAADGTESIDFSHKSKVDRSGCCAFTGLSPGEIVLSLEYDDWMKVLVEEVTLKAGQNTISRVSPRGAPLRVKVSEAGEVALKKFENDQIEYSSIAMNGSLGQILDFGFLPLGPLCLAFTPENSDEKPFSIDFNHQGMSEIDLSQPRAERFVLKESVWNDEGPLLLKDDVLLGMQNQSIRTVTELRSLCEEHEESPGCVVRVRRQGAILEVSVPGALLDEVYDTTEVYRDF